MRVAVALSGGRDSTALLCLAVARGHDVVALHVLHPYASPLAVHNAQLAARKLNVGLSLLPLDRKALDNALSRGFQEMATGDTPWATVCTRCSEIVHKAISDAARQLGANEIWLGMTSVQKSHMGIEPMKSNPPEVWPMVDRTVEDYAYRLMRTYGIGYGLRWSPFLTNCRVNWSIMRESLREGRPNPYLGYFLEHTGNRWKRRMLRVGFYVLNMALRMDPRRKQ